MQWLRALCCAELLLKVRFQSCSLLYLPCSLRLPFSVSRAIRQPGGSTLFGVSCSCTVKPCCTKALSATVCWLQRVSSKGHTPSSECCSWGSSGRGSAALSALRMHRSASRHVSHVQTLCVQGTLGLHRSLCTWAHRNYKIQIVRLQMKVHCLNRKFFKKKTFYLNSNL